MEKYNHKEIEKKWKEQWSKKQLYKTGESNKDNEYILVEFPYPSGNLHVGHWYAFAVTDIYVRYKKMLGKNILFPIGFDSFGLPAENAAIKNNINPRDWTYSNIEYMENQLKSMGASFDWDRKIVTSDPEYYKWTQWLFIQLLNNKIAFQKTGSVNWCPSCKTVLANEQVVAGKCERCDSEIEQKEMKEWKLKITDYAEDLIQGLDKVNWPNHIKEAQKNWIGKSTGTYFSFDINDSDKKIKVFTTRPDTFYGITYLVLAPENILISELSDQISNLEEIKAYIKKAGGKTELQRISENKDKTGVKIEGVSAIHPGTGEILPIFISDYVIASYGTGAVMAVPAHDQRDFEFARMFDLPIKKVIREHCIDNRNPHIDGKEIIEREVIMAIVRNKKDNTFLTLKWKKQDWHTFVTGGIEENEDPVYAAKREILEETGYKNVEFKKYICGPTRSEFFAAHKDVNRIAHMHVLLFDLLDESQDEITDEEKEIHEIVWINRNEITKDMSHAEMDHVLANIDFEEETAFEDLGVVYNSDSFDGMSSKDAAPEITEKFGEATTTYRIRDWSVSRQRYWGCPIPVVHCEKCGAVPVPENELPVRLPDLEDFTPSGDGKSPLSKAVDWVNIECPMCGADSKRETDTLDTFVDSSWYFLRYPDSKNKEQFSSKESQKEWLPVDFYSGGSEHTTMHLLYSRFFQKALYKLGLVEHDEPFLNRNNRGLILGPDGNKMSKSKGNVVDPDELVEKLGADTVRSYLAFIGPYNEAGSYPWDPNGVVGTRRFIERIVSLKEKISEKDASDVEKLLHKTIKGVGEDYQSLKFNTGISKLMILSNLLEKENFSVETYKTLLKLLSPVAPFICEELWSNLSESTSIHLEKWPVFDESKTIDSEIEIMIQVNGKMRGKIKVGKSTEKTDIFDLAKKEESVDKWLKNEAIKKEIYVEGRLVNFVI